MKNQSVITNTRIIYKTRPRELKLNQVEMPQINIGELIEERIAEITFERKKFNLSEFIKIVL